MCSCGIGFLIVFGAIKLHNGGYFGPKRKALPNEENPQMEWDDSGLNITENPLEALEVVLNLIKATWIQNLIDLNSI